MEVRAIQESEISPEATVIAGVLKGLEPVPGSESVLEEVDERLLEVAGFEGKSGQTLTVPYREGVAVIAGLGDEATFESVRAATGNAVRAVKTGEAACLLGLAPIDGATRAVVEGLVLGGYQYRAYKTSDEGKSKLVSVGVVGADEDDVTSSLVGADATNLARDWTNTPAMDTSPQDIAEMISAAAADADIEIEVWDRSRIESEKLGALLGVAAGSDRPPVLMVMSYKPDDASTHLGLVGKGITFDTGGLSIKTAPFMEEMKDDMTGAAVVAAATIAIARAEIPVRITTVIPLTDNAIGGNATRPGDVLRPVQGPTIEVLNTDAEGRLILADGLGVVRRYEPDLIIDVATLTGASKVALGEKIAAVFGSGPDAAERVLKAASRAGEYFWEMPLFKDYRKDLDSNIADIKNITGNRYGGAIAAALFLSEYAGDGDWAHLDIAGPARWRETAGEHVKGGSGVGVRTLLELARLLVEPDA
ncbi:MAG: leucyl aminopeptidase [Acidimicrobiia bacterium]